MFIEKSKNKLNFYENIKGDVIIEELRTEKKTIYDTTLQVGMVFSLVDEYRGEYEMTNNYTRSVQLNIRGNLRTTTVTQ